MSYIQLIKDTLNILDLTIYFEENCLTKERYKGQICLIYKDTLQYTPEEYPHYPTYRKNFFKPPSKGNQVKT
ncbi:transposase [Enterococcus sp. DIV0691]